MGKQTSTQVQKVVSKSEFVELAQGADHSNAEEVKALYHMATQVDNAELEQIAGADYLELKDGETYILQVLGIDEGAMRDLLDDTKFNDAVVLRNLEEAGGEQINADVVMVSTIKKIKERGVTFPFTIKVFVDGKKGAKGREYKNLQIWKY